MKKTVSKKAIVSVHAGLWFIVGILLGAGGVYYLAMKGMLPFLGGA